MNLTRYFETNNEYVVEPKDNEDDGCAVLYLKDSGVSCGIAEIDEVGDFIEMLDSWGLSAKKIAKELEIASKKVLSSSESNYNGAFTIMSFAAPTALDKKVLKHLNKTYASSWRTNPNSGNKINVVVM